MPGQRVAAGALVGSKPSSRPPAASKRAGLAALNPGERELREAGAGGADRLTRGAQSGGRGGDERSELLEEAEELGGLGGYPGGDGGEAGGGSGAAGDRADGDADDDALDDLLEQPLRELEGAVAGVVDVLGVRLARGAEGHEVGGQVADMGAELVGGVDGERYLGGALVPEPTDRGVAVDRDDVEGLAAARQVRAAARSRSVSAPGQTNPATWSRIQPTCGGRSGESPPSEDVGELGSTSTQPPAGSGPPT